MPNPETLESNSEIDDLKTNLSKVCSKVLEKAKLH